MLHGFIQPPQRKQTSKPKKKAMVVAPDGTSAGATVCIADLVAKAKNESIDIVQLLRDHMPVVEVAV